MTTRTHLWPCVAVGLALAILTVVGCTSRPSSAPPKVAIPAGGSASSADANAKLIADWPKPAGALIISGEQHGYLEPCGCTEGQLGGLDRRYDLVERLRGQGWPLALIDLGSFSDAPGARGGPVESQAKFRAALAAFGLLKYDAIALAADDLRQGVGETLGQYINLGDRPKVLSANATPEAGLESAVQPSLRVSAGPIKLGITAVLDPAEFEALNDPDKALLKVKPPEEVLKDVLADLEKDTNAQVLMVQGPVEKARALAQAVPGFEVVVAKSEYVDPAAEPIMLNDGKTMLVQVGQKGKYVGVVGLFQDAKQKYRYQRVHLNNRYKDKVEPIRRLIDQDLQTELKDLKVVEDFPKHNYPGGAPGATFLGAESCKGCHPNTYARWASTKHAQAFEPLKRPERPREFDAECVSCHATGLEYTSGFRSMASTPYLAGNQCENCHGPGSKHAEQPDNKEFSSLMTQAVANPDQNRLCYRCHDDDNSPKFNFTTYYGQIVHKGMDKYDDPKVHQGLPPRPATAPAAE